MSIPLSVQGLYSGGVVERLHDELQKAIDNIADPNTAAKKPRKVKLDITIKPNEQRNMAELVITTSSTLQPPAPLETSIIIDKDKNGKAYASELASGENPGQMSLPGTHETGKVVAFARGA